MALTISARGPAVFFRHSEDGSAESGSAAGRAVRFMRFADAAEVNARGTELSKKPARKATKGG